MKDTKKTWTDPQLIVLAKGTPEEGVLTHCKTMNPNQPHQGPVYVTQDTCAAGPDHANCSNCQSRAVGVT